jgi:hypothetical protein
MTQQNAALVEESNAAAESLKDQAQQLGEIVSFPAGPAPQRRTRHSLSHPRTVSP